MHIKNADGTAKFSVSPVKMLENNGIKKKDILLAESIIEENASLIVAHWNEYFTEKQ